MNSLKKKIDGEDEDEYQGRPAQGGYAPQQQPGGRRSNEFGRRSTDRERYDADPHVLGDDFAGLQMRDNEGTATKKLGFHLVVANNHSTSETFESSAGQP